MVTTFFAGVVAMGFLIASLFFFRFWLRTRDGLFAAFAAAFALLAANQALAEFIELGRDELGWVWLLRVAAFTLIIIAIVRKNIYAGSSKNPRRATGEG
jgi:cobalamin synthase